MVVAGSALTAVVVGLAVVLGLYLPGYLHGHARDSAREAALSAARQRMVNFMNYDYQHYDRYLKRIEQGSTGKFHKQFRKAEKTLRTAVVKNKATATGKVLDAAVQQLSTDAGTASVLLYIDETVSGPNAPAAGGKGSKADGSNKKSGKASLKAKASPKAKATGNGKAGSSKDRSSRTQHYRAAVSMKRVDGRWLVSNLRFL